MLRKIQHKALIWMASFRRKIYLTEMERRILSLKNKHFGSRCFILGMGPSLNVEDINKLKDEVTFSCNKIYLAYGGLSWRPTYYSLADALVAENNAEEIEKLIKENESIFVFSKNVEKNFPNSSVIYINELNGRDCDGISDDLLNGYVSGTTVTYRIIQQAIYMGFKEIYLLGMDFSFLIPEKKIDSGRSDIKDPVLVNDTEVNHFCKDYRKKGETWTVPKLDVQLKAFKRAKVYAEKHSLKIINCSRETKLDVFEKADLDEIIECR